MLKRNINEEKSVWGAEGNKRKRWEKKRSSGNESDDVRKNRRRYNRAVGEGKGKEVIKDGKKQKRDKGDERKREDMQRGGGGTEEKKKVG